MDRRVGFVPITFFSLVIVLTILRLGFFYAFRPLHVASADVVHAFYLGLKFDGRLAAIVIFPLLLMRRRTTVLA